MKKFTALTLAATMTILTPVALLAADNGVKLGGTATVDVGVGLAANNTTTGGVSGGATTDVMAVADASGLLTLDDVAKSIKDTTAASADVQAVTDGSEIQIVKLSSIEAGASGNANVVSDAVIANESGVTTLRTDIAANAAISAKLEAEGLSTDDVVAINTDATGKVWVFVDDAA